MAGGQLKAYKFVVPAGTDSLEVRLSNVVGNPWISLGEGTRFPSPAGELVSGAPVIGSGPYNEYGCDGGNAGLSNTKIITVPNPTAGEWRVLVRAGHSPGPQITYPDASGNLIVTALTTVPLAYDGGEFAVSGQQPGTWRYFSVQVPAGVVGWDVRLRDLTGSVPAMMVRRDQLPEVPVQSDSWKYSYNLATVDRAGLANRKSMARRD
jgi:hypothetical protein